MIEVVAASRLSFCGFMSESLRRNIVVTASPRRRRVGAAAQVRSITAAEREDILSDHAAAVCAALSDRDGTAAATVRRLALGC